MKNIVVLDNKTHGNLKRNSDYSYSHAKHFHLSSLLIHEFPKAVIDFPIVFAKDEQSGQFMPVVLLGLQPGENLYFQQGRWQSLYIPAQVRRHPFFLNQISAEQWQICIDEDSDLLAVNGKTALFNDDGTATQYLEETKKFLADLADKDEQSRKFCAYMVSLELLRPYQLETTNENGEKQVVNGLYIIDEEKLNSLSDEQTSKLQKNGSLSLIYTHLASMGQVERLRALKNMKEQSNN